MENLSFKNFNFIFEEYQNFYNTYNKQELIEMIINEEVSDDIVNVNKQVKKLFNFSRTNKYDIGYFAFRLFKHKNILQGWILIYVNDDNIKMKLMGDLIKDKFYLIEYDKNKDLSDNFILNKPSNAEEVNENTKNPEYIPYLIKQTNKAIKTHLSNS